MKISFTFFFNAKILALSLFFCAPMVTLAQVLFTQNFNSVTSENLTPFTGSGADQFDYIAAPTGGTTASTVRVFNASYPNKLRLFKGSSNSNNPAVARTTDLVATPDFLRIKFKVEVAYTNATNATNTAIVFYVGSGFSTDNVAPTTNIHARFGIGLFTNGTTYSSGTFVVRNMTSFASSADFTGQQEITWYINHSGSEQSYTNPAGGTSTVANDKSDVWIGTTNPAHLDEMNAPTSTALTDFKFVSSLPSSTVVLDDIEVTGANGVVLPVSLTNFTAKKAGTINQLTWETESETNNKGYNVERQNTNGTWVSLGFVNSNGKAATYNFTDNTPLSISYYRLRQIDLDGVETLSKIVSVRQNTKGRISIAPNPTTEYVNIFLNKDDVSEGNITLNLYDITGKQVLLQNTTAETLQLDLSHLAKGVYLLTVQSDNTIYQEKIIRQ